MNSNKKQAYQRSPSSLEAGVSAGRWLSLATLLNRNLPLEGCPCLAEADITALTQTELRFSNSRALEVSDCDFAGCTLSDFRIGASFYSAVRFTTPLGRGVISHFACPSGVIR